VINQIVKENTRSSININNSCSYSSDLINKNGHLLITIKFFKFTDSNEDVTNQELRVWFPNKKNKKIYYKILIFLKILIL